MLYIKSMMNMKVITHFPDMSITPHNFFNHEGRSIFTLDLSLVVRDEISIMLVAGSEKKIILKKNEEIFFFCGDMQLLKKIEFSFIIYLLIQFPFIISVHHIFVYNNICLLYFPSFYSHFYFLIFVGILFM
jgi:hypothetical protein